MGARLASVAVHLPEHQVSTEEVEARIAPFAAPAGLIRRLTGIESRHVMRDDEQASDLAVAAARKLLAETGTAAADIDLLLFASASQDMVEPATAHIVAAKLDLRCPVMDIKNACNSVLNGIEVASALIETGRYRTVLVASGEAPSRAVRWNVTGLTDFLRAFPGYTLSDAGAAVLLTEGGPGILGCGFTAVRGRSMKNWELRVQLGAHPVAYPLVRGIGRLGRAVRVPGVGVVVSEPALAREILTADLVRRRPAFLPRHAARARRDPRGAGRRARRSPCFDSGARGRPSRPDSELSQNGAVPWPLI